MKKKRKDEWIRGTFQVLDVYPFVAGTLYYARVHPAGGTRFLLGIDLSLMSRRIRLDSLLHRDSDALVPVEGLFVEDGVLYQILGELKGSVLAHDLQRSAPLSLSESVHLLKNVTEQWIRMDEAGWFAPIHPQNMLIDEGRLRFLYAAKEGMPAGEGSRDEKRAVYELGSLAFVMLTGSGPDADGRRLSQLRENAPRELEEWITSSLQDHASERPGMRALLEGLQGIPVHKLSETPPEAEKGGFGIPDDPFAPALIHPQPPDVPHDPLDPKEWEGWFAGEGLPIIDGHSPREMPPSGRKVWSKPDRSQVESIPSSSATPVDPSPEEESQKRFRFRRKPAVWAAVLLVLLGLGTGGYFLADGLFAADAEEAARYYGESIRLEQDDQVGEAIAKAKLAVEADPSEKDYLLHLASLYGEQKEYEKAAAVLARGIQEVPEADVYDAWAIYALYAGDLDQADTAIRKAISLDGDNPEFYEHQGSIHSARKKYDQAVQAMTKAVRLKPKEASYHHQLAAYSLKAEDLQKALQHAKEAVRLSPEEPEYHIRVGQVHLAEREQVSANKKLSSGKKKKQTAAAVQAAVDSFNRAVKVDSGNATSHYYLSIAWYYGGELKKAQQSIQQALELRPETAAYHYQYGVVLQRADDRKKAAVHYRKALELEPGNMTYKKAVDQIQ